MKSRMVVAFLFVAYMSACDAVSVGHAPADDQPGDQAETCPPLTYAENPTDAVSALPVRIEGVTVTNFYMYSITDFFGLAMTDNAYGIEFQIGRLISDRSKMRPLLDTEPSNRRLWYEKDSLRFGFQTFYRFRLRAKAFAQATSTHAEGKWWIPLSLRLVPKEVPTRPWFLLIPDSTCSSRAAYAVQSNMTYYRFAQSTKGASLREFEVTRPVAGQVAVSWQVYNAPADRWLYLAFVTEATNLVMSTDRDAHGAYLAMEKQHYENGTTRTSLCGKVYDPAGADFIFFRNLVTDPSDRYARYPGRALEKGNSESVWRWPTEWATPLSETELQRLVTDWNRQQGGLPIDIGQTVILDAADGALRPWYEATVQVGACRRTLMIFIPYCDMWNLFYPSAYSTSTIIAEQPCWYDAFFHGTGDHRLFESNSVWGRRFPR